MAERKRKNTHSNRFEIRFFAGYKGKERPKEVIIGDRKLKIEIIYDRKRVLDERTGKTSEVFTCQMEGKRVRLIVHESGKFEIIYL